MGVDGQLAVGFSHSVPADVKSYGQSCRFPCTWQMLEALSHPFFDELRMPAAGAPFQLPDLFNFSEDGEFGGKTRSSRLLSVPGHRHL